MKISVVTGTRAEFGLLSGLMQLIRDSSMLDVQVVVTGTHLLDEFGHTADAIAEAGLAVDWEVRSITQASIGADVSNQVGAGIIDFTEAFKELAPSAVVLLGDRYEMLAAAIAAFFLKIPIVHLHGGEVTQGAFDDTIRHAITKFSSVHCVAHEDYARRVIQLGEHPDTVHVVGALGVDELSRVTLKCRSDLEEILGIELRETIFLVTYHPVTSGKSDALAETAELIAALESVPDSTVVVTMSNADPDHQDITNAMKMAVNRHPGFWIFSESLGQQNYWSLMAMATAVVGNSSSGILEAASYQTATVNIGPRQTGRIMPSSVVSCAASRDAITAALDEVMSRDFRSELGHVVNPLGGQGAAARIVFVLENIQRSHLGGKVFYEQEKPSPKAHRVS